ncbi:MAG: transcription antitermination factor NusB [Mariprofundaceae bacterium]
MANRHKARMSALEVLYAWGSSEKDHSALPQLIASRIALDERQDQDVEFLRESVLAITAQYETLDQQLKPTIRGRSLNSVGQIEINILRLALWEMVHRLEIPYRVIINEALELAHDYADDPARGFINGILDRISTDVRKHEKPAKKAKLSLRK